jgi:hypothetical protein
VGRVDLGARFPGVGASARLSPGPCAIPGRSSYTGRAPADRRRGRTLNPRCPWPCIHRQRTGFARTRLGTAGTAPRAVGSADTAPGSPRCGPCMGWRSSPRAGAAGGASFSTARSCTRAAIPTRAPERVLVQGIASPPCLAAPHTGDTATSPGAPPGLARMFSAAAQRSAFSARHTRPGTRRSARLALGPAGDAGVDPSNTGRRAQATPFRLPARTQAPSRSPSRGRTSGPCGS